VGGNEGDEQHDIRAGLSLRPHRGALRPADLGARALLSAGAVEIVARYVVSPDRGLPAHIGIMSLVGAGLSAVINNIAALAVLMSIDMNAAKKAKRAVSLSLMPCPSPPFSAA